MMGHRCPTPFHMAKSMTRIDHQAIEFISYCSCSGEEEEQRRAPNLIHTIWRFRQLALWVKQHIESLGTKSKPLTRIVKRFIQLANVRTPPFPGPARDDKWRAYLPPPQRLLQLNNFNTAMAILHGINQWAVFAGGNRQLYSVQSLKFTPVWPELSKRDRKVRCDPHAHSLSSYLNLHDQDFECIEKLMVNEELYRETLLHIPGSPHIPYLDFHLCKILSAAEHIPSSVRGMINFEKSKYLYNLVSQVRSFLLHLLAFFPFPLSWIPLFFPSRPLEQLMQYQENPYNLQPVSKIIDLLSSTVLQLSNDP